MPKQDRGFDKLKKRFTEITKKVGRVLERFTSKKQILTTAEITERIDRELKKGPAPLMARLKDTLNRRHPEERFELRRGNIKGSMLDLDTEMDHRFVERNPGPKLGAAIQKEAVGRLKDKLNRHGETEPKVVAMTGSDLMKKIEKDLGHEVKPESRREMGHYKKSLKGLEVANIQVPTVRNGAESGIEIDYNSLKGCIREAQAKALPAMQKELEKIQVRAREIIRTETMARDLMQKSRNIQAPPHDTTKSVRKLPEILIGKNRGLSR